MCSNQSDHEVSVLGSADFGHVCQLQTPWTGPVSAERPLIDMATPQGERRSGINADQVKRLTDAFEGVPASKKSRLSVASMHEETGSLRGDEDGTDSLLNADEVSFFVISCSLLIKS